MLRSKRALLRSRGIDHKIEQERERRRREIQLLILGGASSGKSTFIKQLRLYHGDEFPADERRELVTLIYENLTDALNILVENMARLGLELADNDNKVFAKELRKEFPKWRHYQFIMSPNVNKGPDPDYVRVKQYMTKIRALAKDTGLLQCMTKTGGLEIELMHAEEYFVQQVDRVSEPDYLPSIQDILFIRKPTVGVQEYLFSHKKIYYRVIDVAGQKNLRKKWIHLFDGVTAVLFFVAISGFCETLEEEATLNSLHDSLTTFGEVTKNRYLDKADVILFLNKKDIFAEYLKTKQLSAYFPQYSGPNTPEACTGYIRECFNVQKSPSKDIYCHVTCAVDRELMKNVIDDVMHIIVEINLRLASSPL